MPSIFPKTKKGSSWHLLRMNRHTSWACVLEHEVSVAVSTVAAWVLIQMAPKLHGLNKSSGLQYKKAVSKKGFNI